MNPYLLRIHNVLLSRGAAPAPVLTVFDENPDALRVVRVFADALLDLKLTGLGMPKGKNGKLRDTLRTVDTPQAESARSALEAHFHLDAAIQAQDVALAVRLACLIDEVNYLVHLETLYRKLNCAFENEGSVVA